MDKQSLQHIFFDLDHTLWDFETNSKLAIQDIFDELDLHRHISLPIFHKVYTRCNDYCWDMYRKNLMSKELLRHQRFYLALKDFGMVDRQLARKMGKKYVEISPYKTTLMPYTNEILQYLSPAYTLHIITNGFSEIQSVKLKESGILHYFTHIITSEKVGKRKPDIQIFRYAMELAKATPSNSLMVGDDYHTDIQGALKAGMQAIWYNPHEQNMPASQDHHVICHLQELTSVL